MDLQKRPILVSIIEIILFYYCVSVILPGGKFGGLKNMYLYALYVKTPKTMKSSIKVNMFVAFFSISI